MYRISITSLEKFRRYLYGVSDWDTKESLLETLSGQFKGNEYTSIGTAFHSIVENGDTIIDNSSDGCKIQVDQHVVVMNRKQVLTALDYRLSMPAASHEVVIGKDYQTTTFPIYVGGRADVVHGILVRDIKTKYSPVKLDDYTDSCQWRFYLELLGADTFYFDIFEFKNYKKETHSTDVSSLALESYGEIECLRYAAMEQHNQQLVDDFCQWITDNNLFHLLKIKQ